MERILGPINGYYVATLAIPVGELGDEYVSEVRVCRMRPRSYFDASPCYEEDSPHRVGDEGRAHDIAYAMALQGFPGLSNKVLASAPALR